MSSSNPVPASGKVYSVKNAVVRHCDDAAIQAAVDLAIKEKRHVHVPIGHYRLAHGITVQNAAALVIEGQSAVDTVLDDNTITGCLQPVVLDSYGSETSLFDRNLLVREEAAGVKAAVEIRGRFNLVGNHLSGFDEKDSSALIHYADPYGRVPANVYRDNVFDRCTRTIAAGQPGR